MSEEVFTNCTNAGPVSVYVKDGKIIRIRPLAAEERDFKPWTIEANGHKYTPARQSSTSPLTSMRSGKGCIQRTGSDIP